MRRRQPGDRLNFRTRILMVFVEVEKIGMRGFVRGRLIRIPRFSMAEIPTHRASSVAQINEDLLPYTGCDMVTC